MPDIQADIEFLRRLDIYSEEKPYAIVLGEDEALDEDVPASNLVFYAEKGLNVKDMRADCQLKFDECGFEFVTYHRSEIEKFEHAEDITAYRTETRDLLTRRFDAIEVVTYEVKLRQNRVFDRQEYDINDSLVAEGPATGAHVDVTIDSARQIVGKYMSQEQKKTYLQKGFRLRIVNTWRPLNLLLEDRPLALCDARTVTANDLAATDRVLPDRIGEIYHIHYNKNQQWYWLEKQKSTEPFIILMYDTKKSQSSLRCMSCKLNTTLKTQMLKAEGVTNVC